MTERNEEAQRLAKKVVSGGIVQQAAERLVYQIVEVCAEHERENTDALRARLEDMRKANEGMAAERDEAIRQSQGYLKHARELLDERDALRARVAKLEAALKDARPYVWSFARYNADERARGICEEIDAALKDAPR